MNYVTPKREPDRQAMWEGLGTFLQLAAAPIKEWLQNPDVIEISCNGPGGVWVEAIGRPHMEYHPVAALTQVVIERLAVQIAGQSNQNVNSETPLLSAAMPHGERFQAVLSPTAPNGGAFSIRKQVINDMTLDDYRVMGGFDGVKVSGPREVDEDLVSDVDRQLADMLEVASAEGLQAALRFAVQNRITMLISGGTSTGKTTFFNALLKEVPDHERIFTIEDTRELKPHQPNWVPVVASKGGQGMARVTIQDCLEVALRMRPDRIFMGEIRGSEAFSFLQAINTGHPGSMSTLHADHPRGAFERLAMATLQAGLGLTKAEILDFVRLVVPVVVQISRDPKTGRRGVSEVYFSKWRRR